MDVTISTSPANRAFRVLLGLLVWLAGSFPGFAMPLCSSCRQVIDPGPMVRWAGQSFHPEHFLCAGCRQPIPAGTRFQVHAGHPYHERCYVDRVAPRCQVCQNPILGRHVKLPRGQAHEDCFERELAAVCASCGRAIRAGEAAVTQEGQTYHATCYRDRVAERCAVCNRGLVGTFLLDGWGNRFHREHATCEHCGRAIGDRTSQGGRIYLDGRRVCGICISTQVRNDRDAAPLIEEVRARLAGLGVNVPAEAAPFQLVDRGQLRALLNRAGMGAANVSGFTSIQTLMQGQKVVRTERKVFILHGMPRELFLGTVAHEFGHVWVNLLTGRKLDPAFEEGSCNYLKALVHEESADPMAVHLLEVMQKDPDPAYGQGYRRVRRLVEARGLQTWLTLLGRGSGFPLGY